MNKGEVARKGGRISAKETSVASLIGFLSLRTCTGTTPLVVVWLDPRRLRAFDLRSIAVCPLSTVVVRPGPLGWSHLISVPALALAVCRPAVLPFI